MIILGLGSNIGDRMGHLRAAIAALGGLVRDLRCSSVYCTPALLPEGAPAEWNIDFYNMAVAGECALEPYALLAELKKLEQQLGRQFRGVWGPREIDIDILAMDGVAMDEEKLTIPHKGLCLRDFALLPLAELAPGLVLGEKTAADICAQKQYKLPLVEEAL